MVNIGLARSRREIRSRQIADCDIGNVVNLLVRGFGDRRPRQFWEQVLTRMAGRAIPPGMPRYGYLLESDGVAVGAILQIFSDIHAGSGAATRCNVSSWYVDPQFRSYASLLVSQALKHKNVTYLNISPAPHTRSIAQAHGYTRYSDGTFVAVPVLCRRGERSRARILDGRELPDTPFEPHERALLLEHADYGCTSLWCVTPDRAYPFVFRRRLVKGLVPCTQLIYCADIADFVRFARPLGGHLGLRGQLFVVNANGPVEGLVGRYFSDTMPKYFKGPDRPRFGDLAYTETALFGV